MPYFYRNNIKYSGGSDSVDLTMAEYKELEANGKVVQDTTYYIIDADENIPSRPNLLINSNFANPVNQRGYVSETVVSEDKYTIDRWAITPGMSIKLNTYESITLTMSTDDNEGKGWFLQRLEDADFLTGKTITYSAKINGVVYSNTVTLSKTSGLQGTMVGDSFNMYMGYAPSLNSYDIDIELPKGNSVTIEWIKLEIGNYATPYYPRLYVEEWQLCQRYYQSVKDTSFPAFASADVFAFEKYFYPMRVAPTVNLAAALYSNNNAVGGCTFTYNYVSNRKITIYANKTAHGLLNKLYICIGFEIKLDAELY